MSDPTNSVWTQANQRYLNAHLARVFAWLELFADYLEAGSGTPPLEQTPPPQRITDAEAEIALALADLTSPSHLDIIATKFELTDFERDILLVCAGMELDAGFETLMARIQGASKIYPTFNLALTTLPSPHWSALSPQAALRRGRLIEPGKGGTLTQAPLYIPERILHFLTGLLTSEELIAGLLTPVETSATPPQSQLDATYTIPLAWADEDETTWPAILLYGDAEADKLTVAAHHAAQKGMMLHSLSLTSVPEYLMEQGLIFRIWEREATLAQSALIVHLPETMDADLMRRAQNFITQRGGPLIFSSREPVSLGNIPRFRLQRPTQTEQADLWVEALAPNTVLPAEDIDRITGQFNLEAADIATVVVAAELEAGANPVTGDIVWEACRIHARPAMQDLAQHIVSASNWEDLILPNSQTRILEDVVRNVRHRTKVYNEWGFASKGTRGLGISAMFAGPSGTGKTLAAEVIANDLGLDLYRIDLSSVVSKYIGETEKNLRKVFDAAERGGAVLLFDEADAIFGKRSEVKDSHDRHANIEVSYLLQRMEAYQGLAVLTTNLKNNIDTAFLRRIRYVTQFSFPDHERRMEIWKRIFPVEMPQLNLDFAKLARLNITGGNIRNIAMGAAFVAADQDEPVQMKHILQATQNEYSKLEKSLSESEVGDWLHAS